jgi:hypothetical protein
MNNELKNLAIVSRKIEEDFWIQAAEFLKEKKIEKLFVVSEDEPEIFDGLECEYRSWNSARSYELEKYKTALINRYESLRLDNLLKKSPETDSIDLLIKVGQKSLENSFIREAAYSEIVFLESLSLETLERAIEEFSRRRRNFGL